MVDDQMRVFGPSGKPGVRAIWSALRAASALVPVFVGSACAAYQHSSVGTALRGNGGPPPVFVGSTADSKTTKVVTVREGLSKAAAFRIVSDLLAEKYAIDVSDPHAGFLMTPWQGSYSRNGVPDLRYRTRLVVRFLGDDWKGLSVRSEANWQQGDEWDVGYDTKLLEQAVADLRAKLGKKD